MFIKDDLNQKEQLELLFQALESARNGVVITDPAKEDNPIIYTNPAFSEITGYCADEILGKNCRFLQGNDRQQEGLKELRVAIEEKRPYTAVLRNYKKDGRLFYNELTVSPVHDSSGKLLAFVGIQNDISARVEAENRISDFYSIVSHELATPIAKIKSSLSVIADGEAGAVNDSVSRFVQISINAADNLWRLIGNILDFKKLESGKFRLLPRRLPLYQLLESAVMEFKPIADSAGLQLSFESQAELFVNADSQRIVQVIDNLLSNAVKFSASGGRIKVVLLKSGNKRARVEVTDQGPGIAEPDFDKVFEKFLQLESPDERYRGGAGLGLAVCKAIIEAHGGSIGLESAIGKGSTFWFELDMLD